MSEGILEEIDGRPTLRFTRRLAHPVDRVWRAVTARDELSEWFVTPMGLTREDEQFEAMGQPVRVLRFAPPRVVEWDWGGERLSFELERDGEGTLLTFRHVFAARDRAPNYASGWEFHLARLDDLLAGQPVAEADPVELRESSDRYSERFGVDPEVGRRILADHFGA